MKKLRLDLDAIRVESFDTTAPKAAAAGTVRGHSGYESCWGVTCSVTCAGTCYGQYTCEAYNTCAHTCDLVNTCDTCATLCEYTCNGQKTCDFGGCGEPSANCW